MSINEDEYNRGWGKNWVRGKDGTVIWTNPDLTPSSTPIIDKYSNRPTPTSTISSNKKKGKGRCPDDRNLSELMSGGHV
jgi:hypothetical protein